ncbi:MAG: hypothetical protein V1717_00840 [Candidatus Micrarchaeota archaeon]
MAFRKRMGVLKGYYVSAHRRRMDFYSWKWRVFLILLAGLIALFVNDYLQVKYAAVVPFEAKADGTLEATSYTMAARLFNWFMTGVLFGIITLAIMYEGEFILGLNKMVSKFEKQVFHPKVKRKAVKQRKK